MSKLKEYLENLIGKNSKEIDKVVQDQLVYGFGKYTIDSEGNLKHIPWDDQLGENEEQEPRRSEVPETED